MIVYVMLGYVESYVLVIYVVLIHALFSFLNDYWKFDLFHITDVSFVN